jgi:cell wall-associated NlpC family hydrolase
VLRACRMPSARVNTRALAQGAAIAAVGFALLASNLTATSAGDLHGAISQDQTAAASLKAQISGDVSRISATAGGLEQAQASLSALEHDLRGREDALRRVQEGLLLARDHLVRLENQMHRASGALASNLVARYEDDPPDVTTVVVQANGFSQLLEQLSFLRRLGDEDAAVIEQTRVARLSVRREVTHLASLEQRDLTLTRQVLTQRDQVAAWHAALLSEQASELRRQTTDKAKLRALSGRLRELEAQAAAEAAHAAAAAAAAAASTADADGATAPTGGAPLVAGGVAVDTSGMVQPPAGAPAAVAQVIAAGNAIATLPYIWGGGHASFHADGYDCSGSVSYALAAAGLVTSPMVSGDFESYGEPGPGRWITIYANADHVWMQVAGWRFDTVAQAYSGTRWAQGGGEFDGFVVRHPPGL